MSSIYDVQVDEATLGVIKVKAPWALRVQAGDSALLYSVRRGSAWLVVDGDEPEPLKLGSVASLPGGHEHCLRDSIATRVPPRAGPLSLQPIGSQRDAAERGDGADLEDEDPAETALLVARVPSTANPLPDVLPPVIHVPPDDRATNGRIQRALTLATLTIDTPEAVRVPILKRLSEILAIELIEFALSRTHGKWQSRVVDERIRRALRCIHARPEQAWTLEALATEAGLARSTFAERFRAIVGDTPKSYLRELRIRHAAAALRGNDAPIYTIASMVGYGSEASFSKAFRQAMGLSPSKYRRIHAR